MKKLKQLLLKLVLVLLTGFVLISLLMVVPFRWLNPPVTMVMAERWFHSENPHYRLRQQWLDWKHIPKQTALAVVTSEDQRFPLHNGFDVDAIFNVLSHAENLTELRGASTISQQVAKNMYLWTGRSWLRKGLEVWFTLVIELVWNKQRILEVYLNIAEWGEGVFGVEAASRYHFAKPAAQLTPLQAALLASCLPSPLNYDPVRPSPQLLQRAKWNLQQQKKLGGIQWLAILN